MHTSLWLLESLKFQSSLPEKHEYCRDKAILECGDEELARKLNEARATRLKLMEMLSEARRQLEMKTGKVRKTYSFSETKNY